MSQRFHGMTRAGLDLQAFGLIHALGRLQLGIGVRQQRAEDGVEILNRKKNEWGTPAFLSFLGLWREFDFHHQHFKPGQTLTT